LGTLYLCCDELYTTIGNKILKDIFDVEGIKTKSILIITLSKYGISKCLLDVCLQLGFSVDNITLIDKATSTYESTKYDFVYVSGGNVFEMLNHMQNHRLISVIQQSILQNRDSIYIGVSAGAMIAGLDIQLGTDFEKNESGIKDLNALNLLKNSAVIPHRSKQDLTRYKKNLSEEQLQNYEHIYNVADGNVRKFSV
jgi:peptidase E